VLHPRAGKPSRNSVEEVDRPRYKRRIGYSSKMLDAGAVDRRTGTGCFGCHQQWRSSTPNRSVESGIDRKMAAFCEGFQMPAVDAGATGITAGV